MPALTDFHVDGPTSVSISRGGDDTGIQLGYTTNDDMITVTVSDHRFYFHTTDSGQMYADAVTLGSTAVIRMTLVSWNQEKLQDLITWSRTGSTAPFTGAPVSGNAQSEGLTAAVGQSSDFKLINLFVTPTKIGAKGYKFKDVVLTGGPEYYDFGNAPRRVALEFTTVRGYLPATALASVIALA